MIQVRKNILSGKWEVQKAVPNSPRFEKVAEFATKEQAENYAATLVKGEAIKEHAAQKKTAQNTGKTAKNAKPRKKTK